MGPACSFQPCKHACVHLLRDWGASLQAVPNNDYRLRRVLEILVQTGRPLKELDLDMGATLDYDFRCFFLNRPRVQLFRRIDARCCAMAAGGLLQVCSDTLILLKMNKPSFISCELPAVVPPL